MKNRVTWSSFKPDNKCYEFHDKGIDMAVPNQSISVREILSKYTRGVLDVKTRKEVYNDTDDWNDTDITNLFIDLTDLDEVKMRIEDSQKEKEVRGKNAKSDITASIIEEPKKTTTKEEIDKATNGEA